MSRELLMLVALLYIWTAYGYYSAGRSGMCLAFIAYAVANLGFAWDVR